MARVQDYHGGGCCGMYHIQGFPIGEDVKNLKVVKDALAAVGNQIIEPGEGRLCEIVLTDGQIEAMPVLVKGLKELGFKLKTRFKNRNSGNYCNVLHWSPTNELHGSPYWKKESK